VLRDRTNVLVHLAPAPVVARVPLTFTLVRPPEWFAQEVELAAFLADRGAPVAPPADDPGPYEHEGVLVTLWAHVDHDLARADPAAGGRALRALHAALADYPGSLPPCDRREEVADVLWRVTPSILASAEELDLLRAAVRRLEPLPPGRPLHGDAHLRNVLWTPDGPLWSDLENACSGPVEFDLAALTWRDIPGSDEALSAYGAHDPALVEASQPALTILLAAWTLVLAARVATPDLIAEACRRVERALVYAREM
jgi:aminoglycoside phosphotransferase (APT) family kinase protein